MLNINQVLQFLCGGGGGVGRRKKLGRFILAVMLALTFYFNYVLFSEIMEPSIGSKVKVNSTFTNDTVNLTVQDRAERQEHQVCKIPDLDPFNPAMKHLFFEPADPGCDLNTTRMFNSTFDSKLVPAITLGEFKAMGVRSCCYRVIFRDEESFNPEEFFRMSVECYPVSLESPTEVKQGHEFIAIFCDNKEPSVIRDFLFGKPAPEFMDLKAFVHLKEEVERRLGQVKGQGQQGPPRLNVAFFGFDAVSRLNFVRSLPKTRRYLLEEMGAIEMLGYNKVASNTLPNLVVLLTSVKYPELKKTCLKGPDTVYFDNCPFIWKQFSEQGYRTAYAEDLSESAIFIRDGFLGFHRAPTDYYLRPFNLAARTFFRPRQPVSSSSCFGHRLIIEVMLEYMTHFTWKMGRERKPFFYFSWEGSLTHDELNDAQLADEPTLKALKALKEYTLLNETMLIIASDHGMRIGAVQYHRQGQLEDMLPLLYIVLPKWFQQTYPRAYQNLKGNAKRFTTPLDLHFTLRHILNPGELQDVEIERREKKLQSRIPKGMSLFLPIPSKRTCKHTVISPSFYCACAQYQLVNGSKEMNAAREGALAAVATINRELAFYRACAKLKLKDILMVQRRKDRSPKRPAYLINFRTTPGDGEFQALVSVEYEGGGWGVAGNVVRRNKYGNQSHCVQSGWAKELCFCK